MTYRSLLFLALSAACAAVHAQTVIDSYNTDGPPRSSPTWGTYSIGFYYSPTVSYTLGSIQSEFAGADGRTSTVGIWTSDPFDGGTLLGSGSFTPAINWSGGTFAGVSLTKGDTYFVGFENIEGLGMNDQNLETPFLYSRYGDSVNRFEFTNSNPYFPMLRFESAATPEPAPIGAMALGVAFLVRLRRRS